MSSWVKTAYSSQHHDDITKRLPVLLALCNRRPPVTGRFFSQMARISMFCSVLVVSQKSCWTYSYNADDLEQPNNHVGHGFNFCVRFFTLNSYSIFHPRFLCLVKANYCLGILPCNTVIDSVSHQSDSGCGNRLCIEPWYGDCFTGMKTIAFKHNKSPFCSHKSRAPSQYKDRLIYVWRFPC